MAVRKVSLSIIFIILLSLCSLYLQNNFNVNAVEFIVAGQLSKTDIDKLQTATKKLVSKNGSNKSFTMVVNYQGRYRQNRMVMTTGRDYLIYNQPMKNGRWIVWGDAREAVIGDRAADRYFKSADVVGQTLEISGLPYKIVGVIKGSDMIFISFHEDSKLHWDKKSISFVISDKKRLQLHAELLEGSLKGLGLEILDTVIYRQEINFYVNVLIIYLLFYAIRLLKSYWFYLWKETAALYGGYKEQHRTTELFRYLLENIRKLFFLLISAAGFALALFMLIRLAMLLRISPAIIPDNLFSPTSYINVIKMNLKIYTNRVTNGMDGILLRAHILNFIMLFYIILALAINKRPSVLRD